MKRFLRSGYTCLLFLFILNGAKAACPGLTFTVAPSTFVYCGVPATVVLNNTSSGGSAAGTTFEFYRGGSLFQTVVGPSTVNDGLGAAGTYNYTIIAITPSSCRDTINFSVQVVIAPVPSFTFTPVSPCPGATVTFNNTSTGIIGGTTWLWDFGDASPTSTQQNPTHVYATTGTYTISLTQTNAAGCAVTVTQNITVSPLPVANFTFGPNNQCPHTPITFTSTSTGVLPGATYFWDFGDGNTSTQQNPVHSFSYPGGVFNVSLTVTNPGSCAATIVIPVTVLPSPNINISGDDGDGNTFWCLTFMDTNTVAPITFFNTTTGANSYSWNYGDGSPTFFTLSTASHTHTYSNYGTFIVTFTATGPNGCVSQDTLHVVFENTISGSFSIPPAQFQGCIPHTICPINTSINANQWTWNFGDGSPPITTNNPVPPCHTYTTGGVFTISLNAQNSCYSQVSTVQTGTLGGPPVINFNPQPNPGCSPQLVTMNNTTTGASPNTNFFWHFGRGPGDTLRGVRNPPPQLYYQGTYTITLISGNACGRDTLQRTITIDSIPRLNITAVPTDGCTPLTVVVTNNSQANAASHAWYINGGLCCPVTPNYTTYNIPNQVFTAPPGNNSVVHTIRYVISNHCGTRDTTINIRVHPTVLANFNMSPLVICEGGSVTFTNTSLGDSLSWNWNFGNGNTASTAGPHTQTYPTAGTYNVTLIVNGFCGRDTLVRTLTVNPYPVINFTPNPTGGCVPLTVNITNNSTPGATYTWDFGAGATPATFSGFSPPPVTYNTVGTKTITLTGNLNGCIASGTQTVTVDVRPVPTFTATPLSGCSPLTVTINNTTATSGGETWAWTFGDGNTSTLQNPGTHVYTNPGSTTLVFPLKLVVTNSSGCRDSLTRNITVYPLPVAGFTVAVSACEGEPVPFTNTSTGASSYQWNFGDATTSTVLNPTHTYSTAGNYTVQLISITAFGCRDTATANINIRPSPNAAFVADTVCIGNATTFTDLSTGSLINWAWTFGDGNTSSTQNPTHAYSPAATYNVKLVVENNANCRDSVTIPVLVRPVPTASFNAPPACFSSASLFTNTSTGGPNIFNWDFGDGFTGNTANPSHTYGMADTFDVTLIVVTGVGCRDTITQQHIVHPIPVPLFTADTVCYLDSTTFLSTSLGAPNTFTWVFGDGNSDVSNNNNPTHYYTLADTFNVSLIAGYSSTGCRDTITIPVIVRPTPVASFSVNTACVNDTTFFTDLSTASPTIWSWNFGDASPLDNNQHPNHVYPGPATYNVTFAVENTFGCQDTVIQPVTVNPRPVAAFATDTVCLNLFTTFTDQSLSSLSWNWNFGDGSPNDILQNPSHAFPADGTYNVTQIVWNVFGCTDTVTNPVVVNPLPVSAFTASTSCFGYNTAFTDGSSSAVSWNWDFGDSSGTSSQQNPLYLYGADSTYPVTLIVNNIFACADTLTQPVVVLPIPVAGFQYPVVCAGVPVTFTDTTLNTPNSWSWDFGDGSAIDTVQNPVHTYTPGNIYNITFIAGNSVGCFDTLNTTVTVNTVPVPAFTHDTVCAGNLTSFINGSTDPNPMTYLWTFGDGNSSPQINPQYIYPDSGIYSVELYATNNWGCVDSITEQIYVAPNPVADFLADSVCSGSPSGFMNNSSPWATAFLWDFGDGGSSTLQNPSYTFAGPGNQTVTLAVTTAFGCTDAITKNVVSLDAPVSGFTVQPILCEQRVIQFTNTSFNNPSGFTWAFGDGSNSAQADPAHIYASAGTYPVTLIAVNSIGCPDTSSMSITVSENPVAAFGADTVCIGSATYFTNQSSGAGPLIWFWDFGNNNNTSYDQNPGYIFFDSAGVYNVTLIVTNPAGCADTVANPILLTPLPVAAFISSPAMPAFITPDNGLVSFTNLSAYASQFLWDFGDGNTSTIPNPSHDYSSAGTYCVTLVASSIGGCSDTILACEISVQLGTPIIPNTFTPNGDDVNDVFEIPNIELFPDNKLVVFNRWGNLVYEKEHYNNEWDGTNFRNGERLPDGAYFYVFSPGDEIPDIVGEVVIFR